MKYFLAIDCGLTKVKVNIFASDGKKLFEEQADTPLHNLMVDTMQLRKIVIALIQKLIDRAKLKPSDIKAVATSGHGNGLYLVGEHGVLPYGYSSMFEESQAFTPDTDEVFPITNQTSWSGQPLPILAYIKNREPEIFGQTKKVLFCKDIIKYFLTGKIVTEYTDASAAGLLNYKTNDYEDALLNVYGLSECRRLLPDISCSTDIIGLVCESFAEESGLSKQTVVVGGMFDVNACMLGAGVSKPDKYCMIGGTWGINSAVVHAPVSDKRIMQCCNYLYPTQYMCIDSAPTSCTNLEWFLRNVLRDMDYETANDIVENQPIDGALLYLPYLFRVSDVNCSGSFVGLTAEHTYKDMLRAVYEGIVFEHARRIEKLKQAGIVYDSAVLTGGVANSRVFCQMFADVTGLKIQTVQQSQTGSLGGVILCTVATGVYDTIDEAVENMVQVKDIYLPKHNRAYREKYRLFNYIVNEKE